MKRVIALSLTALSFAAAAQPGAFVDQARVLHAQPRHEQVQVPREECSSHWVQDGAPAAAARNYGGVVIGGVAGGILGNQVGKGHGREAATAVGAVVGALAGDHLANRNSVVLATAPQMAREVRSCRMVSDVQSRIAGYDVRYEYQGREYTAFLREHPGRTLPVQVSVAPVQREYHSRY